MLLRPYKGTVLNHAHASLGKSVCIKIHGKAVPAKTDVEFNVSVQQKYIVGDFIIQNVYPDISCVVLNQTFHSEVIINASTIIKQKFSKEVTITVISSLRRNNCKGSMELVCLVSNLTFNTEPYPFDVCSDEKDSNVPTTYIVISMMLVLVVVAVILILHIKEKIKCFGTRSRGQITFFLEEIIELHQRIKERHVIWIANITRRLRTTT
ncbi:unnamed protein product [Mytilus coruscus]|uniref:Uncharacterized protein n=1 Tax=Mytilus coruscus TaxID=42192 RepID=A0A6J7ZXX9_MYTCO|nr:unnamed protein product [Mytilus coruscus]